MEHINTFDCDGVITLGIYPGPKDKIITGRSFEERVETLEYLKAKGIHNEVFFNPLTFDEKTRETSGIHKANILKMLMNSGYKISCHFEDDEIQISQIIRNIPENTINIIHVNHNGLINMENVSHSEHMKNMK